MTVPPQEEDTLRVYIALRRKRPMMAAHLDQYIRVYSVKTGGFTLIGADNSTVYTTYKEAADARHGAILKVLLETERAYG